MSVLDISDEQARLSTKMKVWRWVQEDFEVSQGASKSDQEAEETLRAHIQGMEAQKPTPETVITDDLEALIAFLLPQYRTVYQGYVVMQRVLSRLDDPQRLSTQVE